MLLLFKNIRERWPVLVTLVGVNVKTTVSSTRLGWLWWLLNPLITMMIYYFFIRVVMNRGGDNYHLFVLTGIVAWQSFGVGLTGAITVITKNKQLIKQVALPVEMLVLIPSLVQLFFGTVGMLIVMAINYSVIGIHSVGMVLLLLLIAMSSYGFGLFLSVIHVHIKDTKNLVGYVLRAGFFLSPVLFPISRVTDNPNIPEFAKSIFLLNPMAWIIPALRTVLLDGIWFDWQGFLIVFVLLSLLIRTGLWWVRLNASTIIKMV